MVTGSVSTAVCQTPSGGSEGTTRTQRSNGRPGLSVADQERRWVGVQSPVARLSVIFGDGTFPAVTRAPWVSSSLNQAGKSRATSTGQRGAVAS